MSKEEQKMTDSAFGDKLQWSLLPTPKPDIATEGHLQSLGLEVSDGLPKFRLNEPGPSALASSIFQLNNMVNDESEQSFVVLGHTSLESIRESSLAQYQEIQQKSQLIDHSPSISIMSPLEIEENLKKVLEENIKLKETLKQNNTAIKQQFNTITKWQKEVMEVCDNHKQKFVETKELINKLKKENDELKEKIEKNNSLEASLSSSVTAPDLPLLKKSDYVSTEKFLINNRYYYYNTQESEPLSIVGGINTSTVHGFCMPSDTETSTSTTLCNTCVDSNTQIDKEEKMQNNQVASDKEQELVKKIDILTKELNYVKDNHSKTQELLQELEKRYMTHIEIFSQQLQKSHKELEAFKEKAQDDTSNASELEKLVSKCCEKDNELKYLKEIISSLEQQIKKYEENAYSTVNMELDISGETSAEKDTLRDNVKIYTEKVETLKKCFLLQCSRYLRIQEFLKESADIIQTFENANVLANSDMPTEKISLYKEKLCDYRKRLIDEQLQSIDDKMTTIKVQKQFQKVLSDYNAVIYELEILRDENSKLMTMQSKAAEENSQKLAEIKKHLDDENQILSKEKNELLAEQLNVQFLKNSIDDEKKSLETERHSLSLEKKRLAEERTSLFEERTSLDRQSKLYEAEEDTLQKEKKTLQKKCDDLNNEIVKLQQELNLAGVTIQQLRADNAKLKENEEIISVYKIQTEMHQKEFEEMRLAQQTLQDQLQSLSMTNLQLRTENDRLGGTGGTSSQEETREEARGVASDKNSEPNRIFCPKCKNGIPVDRISRHFSLCYNRI